MTPLFRKNPEKAAADDEISDDLLDAIPEIGGNSTLDAGPFAGFVRAEPPVSFTVLADDAPETESPILAPPPPAAPVTAPPPEPAPAPQPAAPTPRLYMPAAPPPDQPATPFMPASPLAQPAPPPMQQQPQAAPAPMLDVNAFDTDVHGLVAQVRAQMEGVFQAELGRVESSFGTLLKQMEARLAQAQLELNGVRAEHDRVRAENEKKAEALRDLKKALENI